MRLESQASASASQRGTSEPPADMQHQPPNRDGFHEQSGLRRSRAPFKIAGVTMGSNENLAMCNDELASVFATRRRRRRSATPVKIGGILMGDENGSDTEADLSVGSNGPFGATGSLTRRSKRASYHPGMTSNRRSSNLGMWGQRMFVNSPTEQEEQQNQPSIKKAPAPMQNGHHNTDSPMGDTGMNNVKQFLTDMHSEITALTSNAYSLVNESNSIEATTTSSSSKMMNGHTESRESKSESTTTSTEEVVRRETKTMSTKTSEEKMSTSHSINKTKNEASAYSYSSTFESTQHSSAVTKQESKAAPAPVVNKRSDRNASATPDDLPRLDSLPVGGYMNPLNSQHNHQKEEAEEDRLERCSTVSVEETIVIGAKSASAPVEADDEVIEVNPDQVKYHSGETPHPNRFEAEQIFTVMSEAEEETEDAEIVEVTPGEVHYHDAIAKQMGLLVPPPANVNNPAEAVSKSPSPHLAIISDFIETHKKKTSPVPPPVDHDKTPEPLTFIEETSSTKVECSTTTSEEVVVESTAMVADSVLTSVASPSVHLEERGSAVTRSEEHSMICSAASEVEATELKYVVDHEETKAMEELFDKLVADESAKLGGGSNLNPGHKRRHSFDSIEAWLLKSEAAEAPPEATDHAPSQTSNDRKDSEAVQGPFSTLSAMNQDKMNKLKNKRARNRTIDYSSLPSGSEWYAGTVACSSKTYAPTPTLEAEPKKKLIVEMGCQTSSFDSASTSSEPNTPMSDKKPGLNIIIDKLKNIETKLDELKTLDQAPQSSYPPSSESPLSSLEPQFPEVGPTPTQHTLNEYTPSVVSLASPGSRSPVPSQLPSETSTDDASMDHYKVENQMPPKLNEVAPVDDDEDTLKEDEDAQSAATDVTHTTDIIEEDEYGTVSTASQMANVVVSSPAVTPCPTANDKRLGAIKKDHVDIVSIGTMSEVEPDDEDDEDSLSSGRQSRIEELAKKIMEEEAIIEQYERQRHPSAPQLQREPINLELDTVSERSEIGDEEDTSLNHELPHENTDSPARKTSDPTSQASASATSSSSSQRLRRTRSASRERNLNKIRFCWRCHESGHESFDCTVEMQPANWCPRCLETSHWEDNCWVNAKEVFCNICTLPGHLPCLHQTNDFRQRKLVIETFGWLAFKDWFREPEFWSWWNCSGFTNVPLYKLMQHRPHVASPDLQEVPE